jgi:Domain of unknown function (DUF4383)
MAWQYSATLQSLNRRIMVEFWLGKQPADEVHRNSVQRAFAANPPHLYGGNVTRSMPGTTPGARTDVQKAALAVGAVFLLVGVLGFIPGITSHYSDMSFGGHHSMAKLLGIFQVSVLHNIVHLLFGAAGIAMARQARTAYLYLVGGGVIYLVLWLYGLIIDKSSSANFVPVNTADNWLHFLLGVGMIAAGVLLYRRLTADQTAAR